MSHDDDPRTEADEDHRDDSPDAPPDAPPDEHPRDDAEGTKEDSPDNPSADDRPGDWRDDGPDDRDDDPAADEDHDDASAADDDPPDDRGDDPPDDRQDDAAPDDDHRRLVAESRKYRQRAQRAEQALTEQAAAHQRLLEELDQRHKRDLAEANKRGEALAAQLRKAVGADRLKSALAARGVTRVDQAAYLLGRYVQVDVAGDEPAVRVVDDAGRPVALNADAADASPARENSSARDNSPAGATISIGRLVDTWLAEQGAHFLPPSGDTGSGARKGPAEEFADVAELERDSARRYAFIRRHGAEEYLRRLGQWKRRRVGRG